MLANKYKLIEKLSQGSFGKVFKAENIRTGEIVAIKTEVKSKEQKSLKMEAKIYHYLANANGFPRLKWFGTTDNVNYLVTNLLECSITNLVKKSGPLSLKTVLLFGRQMIERLETLHNHYLIHRDIKPDNFMINITDRTNKIFLIDFGFCKRYNHDGKHIDFKTNNSLIGTANFVSINVHKGSEPSRRDDLESSLYVMIYMLFGKDFGTNTNNLKQLILNKELLTNVPQFLKVAINYVRTLKFEEDPDYKYIMQLFLDESDLDQDLEQDLDQDLEEEDDDLEEDLEDDDA